MLLHVQKEKVDELGMIDIANEFVNKVSCRNKSSEFSLLQISKLSFVLKARQTQT